MKKLFLFLMVFSYGFSCQFMSDPDIYQRKMIDTIKELKFQEKIYCDEDDEKMVYYFDSSDFLQVGLVYNSEDIEKKSVKELSEMFKIFASDSQKIYNLFSKKFNSTKASSIDIDGVEIRMYIETPEEYIMFSKIVLDFEAVDASGYINSDYKSLIKDNFSGLLKMQIYYTDDILY